MYQGNRNGSKRSRDVSREWNEEKFRKLPFSHKLSERTK
ncbi:MAG: hypothetical protein C5S38_03800 [Candidatus Methanophagaceae archaeon]|nr:MAG: hypothetical protein C5S38_03800 [Methanophagales archaeon]